MEIDAKTKYLIKLSAEERHFLEIGLSQWLDAHPTGYLYEGPNGLGAFMQELYEKVCETHRGISRLVRPE